MTRTSITDDSGRRHGDTTNPPGWWGHALFIARKDVKYNFRQRETWLWTFIMPVIFMFFIGTITSGNGIGGSTPAPLALVATPAAGYLADTLAARLEAEGFVIERHTDGPAAGAHLAGTPSTGAEAGGPHRQGDEATEPPARQLEIPAGFTDSVHARRPVSLLLRLADDGLTADHDRIRVSRAVYGLLADVTLIGVGGTPLDAAALDAIARLPRPLSLAVTAAGERRSIPSGFEQAVPGILTMFTLLGLLTSGSVLVVIERREGLLRRLASTPLRRSSIVAGKLGGRLAQGMVQIAFAMLAGSVLFGMRWGTQLPILALLLVIYGTLCAALGLLLGSVARTEGQAIGVAVLASNLLAALGGCWWPIEITPRWMQQFALALPTGWAMDALHRLVSFGMGPSSVVPHLVVMSLAALVAILVLARTFRFE